MRKDTLVVSLLSAGLLTSSIADAGGHGSAGYHHQGSGHGCGKVEGPVDHSARPVTLALIGDTPYGADQVTDFPNLVDAINSDPEISRVVHLGDIKNGSTRCDDEYFALTFDYFNTFEDPFVLTPGDNDWTDCHRSNNGKYDPIERLETLRSVFYANPRFTLGQNPARVFTQAHMTGYGDLPENSAWVEARTVFSTLHVVGSRNNLAPWFTDDLTDEFVDDPERRLADVAERTRAAIDWIDFTFALTNRRTEGVVLMMQADTWPGNPDDGFSEILQRIAAHSVEFERPVLVVQGDSHVYKVDQPLLSGDATHGITEPVPNLTRVVVEGSTTREYLALTVDPKAEQLFSWQRVTR